MCSRDATPRGPSRRAARYLPARRGPPGPEYRHEHATPMIDPLGLLPLAAAAGRGTVNGVEAARLVAAGLTLLRRSAPLVRALHGRRAALLLPTTPAFFTGLAAAEGRGAVLVNPLAAPP